MHPGERANDRLSLSAVVRVPRSSERSEEKKKRHAYYTSPNSYTKLPFVYPCVLPCAAARCPTVLSTVLDAPQPEYARESAPRPGRPWVLRREWQARLRAQGNSGRRGPFPENPNGAQFGKYIKLDFTVLSFEHR